MLLRTPDKLFEEAGADPVQLEILLRHAQQERKFARIVVLVVVALLLVPVIGLSVVAFQSFSQIRAGHFDQVAESLKPISRLKLSAPVLISCSFSLSLAITLLIIAVREADIRVKTLLLFRGFHASKTRSLGPGAS